MRRLSRVFVPALALIFLLCLIAPSADAASLLVIQTAATSGGFGYGYGNSDWTQMTAFLQAAFGVSNITVGSDTTGIMGYDRVWLDQRWSGGSLTPQEISDLTAFVATGRRAVFIGENNDWTLWNSQILGIVGGSYAGGEVDGVVNTILPSPLTNGVNSILTIVDGIAVGGTPLFDQNVATLWGSSENVLSILSVNIMDDDFISNNDNLTFSNNTAQWLAGTVPEPSCVVLVAMGLGLLGGRVLWRRKKG